MRLKDLTGEKFGKWTVQQRVQTNRNHTVWRCICECGNIRDVYSSHLIQGKSKRCLKCVPKGSDHHQWKGFGDISGDYWDSIKRGASGGKGRSRKGVDFTITIEYAWNLFLKQGKKCALSGQDIIIKYNEPPEARIPKKKWRLYCFKDDKELPFYPMYRQSALFVWQRSQSSRHTH